MSTKTIYKRIALVAVAALGAGVLSVAPANATNNNATGGAFVSPETNVMNIAVTASTTGSALASISAATSVGLLTNSTTMGTGLTQTATLLSTGTLGVYGQSAAGDAVSFVVTGGTIASAVATDTLVRLNATSTAVASQEEASDAVTVLSITVRPNSGATSMRIEMYTKTVTEDPATTLAIANGSVSRGTLRSAVNVTVASASAGGAYDAGNSLVNIVAAAATAATGVDEDAAKIANASSSIGYIAIDLRDAYDRTLDGKGALVIESTNGAGVGYDGTSGLVLPTANVAVSADTSGTITVARPAAFANKGFSTTVTIKYNGVAVGSKSLTFLGEVAKVTASSPKIGAVGQSSNLIAFRLAYADDQGNALYPTTTDTSAVAATLNSYVTGLSVGEIGSSAGLAKGTLSCGASAGSADVQVQHVNPLSATVVKSNVWKATCAGDAATYTASWDKASYTPGSIATLSITFKDAKGNLANAYTPVGTTANPIVITGGPSATGAAVTAPADGDKANSADGVKTFQFIVGTTTGDFSAVVAVPVVTANGVATNQTASYKIANATTGVTNEDVLKAIVSLIASINKQIAALQKALLRR